MIPLDAETNYPDIVSINSTAGGYGNIHIKVCFVSQFVYIVKL